MRLKFENFDFLQGCQFLVKVSGQRGRSHLR